MANIPGMLLQMLSFVSFNNCHAGACNDLMQHVRGCHVSDLALACVRHGAVHESEAMQQ